MSEKLVVAVEQQIATLVPRFLAHRAADVGKLSAAVADADFETIRATAHAMKGAGGAYGFPEISRLGAALEECALHRDAAAISELVANLKDYLGRVEVKYE
jgi:HPt (histidine-containing phosphotransfer) domain-containing protein